MKLLRCHIENFGVLSNFDFEFSSGLTIVCKENGFGKSTFAAFIKAMFYGMPRTGPRNIALNERKRYEPWQGGNYGGFLEFEYQSICYRVTRYFGKTATKDTFSIINLSNRDSKNPFSEKLGEELFQLDADSFSRSTYMPQLCVHDMESTTSIRAKLGNLVDDTNDINNFDTASESLRQLRSKFKAYRGSNDVIHNLEKKYNSLEDKKYNAEKEKERLQQVSEEIEQLNTKKELKIEAVSNLREKIRKASAQKALQIQMNQYHDLQQSIEQKKRYLRNLDKCYPAGYPTLEEIKWQRENLSSLHQATKRLQNLTLLDKDREIVEKEKSFFSDSAVVTENIDKCDRLCGELTKVSAKLTAQMLPEELHRLEELSLKFEKGIPKEDDIEKCLLAADEMNAAERQFANLTMSAEDQSSLEQLKYFFKNGIPDEKIISDCEESQRNLEILEKSRKSCVLSDKDRQDFQTLQRTFASEVPSDRDIKERQNECRRIVELTSKKNTKTTQVQEVSVSERSRSKVYLLCGSISIILLICGIICIVANLFIPSILFFVIGFIGLLVTFWFHTRQMVNDNNRSTSVIMASAITDDENQELYDLKHTVNDFLLQFYSDISDPESKLVQLLLDTKKFNRLKSEKKEVEERQIKFNQEIENNLKKLHKIFECYYPGQSYSDTFVEELKKSVNHYNRLVEEANQIAKKRSDISKKIETYRKQIVDLLQNYYPLELPVDLRQGIRELSSDVEDFRTLKRKEQAIKKDTIEEQVQELTKQIQEILITYKAFSSSISVRQCLQELRKRFEIYKECSERVENFSRNRKEAFNQQQSAKNKIQAFLQKYRLSNDHPEKIIDSADEDIRNYSAVRDDLHKVTKKLDAFLAENPEINNESNVELELDELPNPEVLQKAEKEIQKEVDDIEKHLRELRQKRDSLRRVVENISSWDDQMMRIKMEYQSAEKKYMLLDQTIELLNRAKDNLANSYVGTIERGFKQYADLLLGKHLGHVMVDKDLKVHIDERGAAREVGSFSIGTVDSIMLCMRLSLIDALFTKEKPVLILDDPFVNFDDERTKHALEILDKISQSHQIIYLVCNSSRI